MRCGSSRLATNCEPPCRGATPGRGIIAQVGGFYSMSVRSRFNGCGLVETLSRFSVAEVEKQLPMARAVCVSPAPRPGRPADAPPRGPSGTSPLQDPADLAVSMPRGRFGRLAKWHCFAVCSLLQDQSPTRCDQNQFKLGSHEERETRSESSLRVDQRISRGACALARCNLLRYFEACACSASSGSSARHGVCRVYDERLCKCLCSS